MTTLNDLMYIGYDPGKRLDPAGIVVVRSSPVTGLMNVVFVGELKKLEYRKQLARLQLLISRLDRPTLIIDRGGAGESICEMAADTLQGCAGIVGITSTGGANGVVMQSATSGTVSKAALLRSVQTVVMDRRLTIPNIPETARLRHQLTTLETTDGKAANDRSQSGHHFDLVSALGLITSYTTRLTARVLA
jgi:hypothetical protein